MLVSIFCFLFFADERNGICMRPSAFPLCAKGVSEVAAKPELGMYIHTVEPLTHPPSYLFFPIRRLR